MCILRWKEWDNLWGDEIWKKREALEDVKWNTWISMVSEALPCTECSLWSLDIENWKKVLEKKSIAGRAIVFFPPHLCFIPWAVPCIKTYLFCKNNYGLLTCYMCKALLQALWWGIQSCIIDDFYLKIASIAYKLLRKQIRKHIECLLHANTMLRARNKRERRISVIKNLWSNEGERQKESICNSQSDKSKDRGMFRRQAGEPRRRTPTSDQRVEDL